MFSAFAHFCGQISAAGASEVKENAAVGAFDGRTATSQPRRVVAHHGVAGYPEIHRCWRVFNLGSWNLACRQKFGRK